MTNRILIALAAIGVAVLLGAFWLLPGGEGEYRDSPDGQWRAHASALSRGTLLGSRRRYVELSLEQLADRSTRWRQRIPYTSADTVPAYGDRRARIISWSSDSSQFTVGTTNGAVLSVLVAAAMDAQVGNATNGSQPIHPETNRTASLDGSQR